jgi:5-methylcytosine-specific restriction endonuclease McrA
MLKRSVWVARRVYSAAWRKELGEWMNNPHTSSMSDAMKSHAAKNRHIQKVRESRMCQACGAFSIIGGDRLRESNKSVHNAYYCDKECAESDRGRVYRTAEAYQAKVDARCQREGKLRNWKKEVCRIHDRECRICKRRLFARSKGSSPLCSELCRKKETALREWIKNRAKQNPKEVQCSACGIAFTALTRTKEDQHYCSHACMVKQVRRNRRHTAREKERKRIRRMLGKVSLTSQFYKFKKTCQMCRCKVEMLKEYAPNQASVDHIVPLSRGGLHVEENLQLACVTCNSKKSDTLAIGKQLLLY